MPFGPYLILALEDHDDEPLNTQGQEGEGSGDESEAQHFDNDLLDNNYEDLPAEENWSWDSREPTVENEVCDKSSRAGAGRRKRSQASNKCRDGANFYPDSEDEDTQQREHSLYLCRGVVRDDIGDLQVLNDARHNQGDEDVPPPTSPLDDSRERTRGRTGKRTRKSPKPQRSTAEDGHESPELAIDELNNISLQQQVEQGKGDTATLEKGQRRKKARFFLDCAQLPRRVSKDPTPAPLTLSDPEDERSIQANVVEEMLPATGLLNQSSKKQEPRRREIMECVLLPPVRIRKRVEEHGSALPPKDAEGQGQTEQQTMTASEPELSKDIEEQVHTQQQTRTVQEPILSEDAEEEVLTQLEQTTAAPVLKPAPKLVWVFTTPKQFAKYRRL
ncbi:hypothetical protein EMPS_10677 [Entomortierella parvispora]|uniref:Uncharacterized protein n=1 Tax=Entomortierella parvispora TaxID=205924 RepID=A0A9P3HL17_9FUNG|nr:hypothetical protein EMPS_10677 [Entomortierella parvispora]